MQHRTGLYREVEDALGEPLEAFVTAERAKGRSWRLIAREIETRTGHALAPETVRVWMTYQRRATA